MIFRKVLYVFLVNLLCCAHAISCEIYPDILSQLPKNIRHNCVYTSVTPSDLASMSFVAKIFHQELSTTPFDLPTINQNGLKFALSQFALKFDQNAEYKQLTTLYRAYLRHRNWRMGEAIHSSFPKLPLNDQNACLRLCALPLKPEDNLNGFKRRQIVELVIDKYSQYDSFSCKVMYPFIIPLLQGSKSLTRLYFDSCQMDEQQWKSAFDAISGQSQITVVKFEDYKISESLINYLCNTSHVWRHKVYELHFITSENEYRISSTTFLNILTAFPNLERFESIRSCCLSGPFTLNAVFPRLNYYLKKLMFSFDTVTVEFLTVVSNSLSLMPKLEELTIYYSMPGDACVPILMQIKKQRPRLELYGFFENRISLDVMRQVVEVFADLGYPQEINVGMLFVPDFIGQYNTEYRKRRNMSYYGSPY